MPFVHLNALSEHLVALSGAQSADFTVLGGNVEPEKENNSGIGRNIYIKNCITWNTKGGEGKETMEELFQKCLSWSLPSVG